MSYWRCPCPISHVDISAASWPKTWETGKTKGFETFEARYRARNGLVIPVELSINYLAFRGEEYFVVFSRDITERRWAEEALRKSEERFRDFAESAADRFWEMDENFRISYFLDSSGEVDVFLDSSREVDVASVEQAHNKTPWELFAADLEHDKNWQDHKATLEAHEPYRNFEHAYRDQTGAIRHRRVSGQLIFDESGGFRGYRGVVTDITERKRAEEALRFTQFTVDNASDPIMWMRPEGQIIEVNEAMCQALGYTREEFQSMMVSDIDPNVAAPDWPERWEAIKASGSYIFESVHKARDGRLIPVEISIDHLDYEGEKFLNVFARDITERKRAEEALRDSEEYYRSLYENAPVMMHTLDRNRHLTRVNEAWLQTLGYGRDEVIGRKSTDFMTPESRARAAKTHIPEMLEKGRVFDVPYTYVKKNGDTVEALLSAFAERSEEGDVVRSVAVIIDVTERK